MFVQSVLFCSKWQVINNSGVYLSVATGSFSFEPGGGGGGSTIIFSYKRRLGGGGGGVIVCLDTDVYIRSTIYSSVVWSTIDVMSQCRVFT